MVSLRLRNKVREELGSLVLFRAFEMVRVAVTVFVRACEWVGFAVSGDAEEGGD